MIRPVKWEEYKLIILNQRLLPAEEKYEKLETLEECVIAIKEMKVRGAPLIGFVAIYALALWIKNNSLNNIEGFLSAADYLSKARPTAVNLKFEIDDCIKMAKKFWIDNNSFDSFLPVLVNHANIKINNLSKDNHKMAETTIKYLKNTVGEKKYKIMTLCNTGRLACGTLGTALGVVSKLSQYNLLEHVYACETRPFLQGSRLTAFELSKEKISYDIIVEGAMSYILEEKDVDAVFVGADRIAQNGDTANKIGTSTLAIVAKYYKIPFLVVAPMSSFDTLLESGKEIPIEMRESSEIFDKNYHSDNLELNALNPSFDITTSNLITGMICERGLITPVNEQNLQEVVNV